MFCDEASIYLKAGDGGAGKVSLRHEKYVPRGGPDGGDGGRGGDIIFMACHNENTLSNLKGMYRYLASSGESGEERFKHGKNGDDLIIKVPIGTLVKEKLSNKTLADLKSDGEMACIVKGGRGGYGNAHFKSSTHKTPRFSEKGEPGEEMEVDLELKIAADVGVIGFPSVGKSTLISVVSNSKPKIAEYHFTTLVPNLGVVKIGQENFMMADIPGLIEGAAEGKGLGNKFLKHIERCRILIHVLDIGSKDIADDYLKLRKELKKYSNVLYKKEEIVAINKIDVIDQDLLDMMIEELRKKVSALKKKKIFPMSAVTHKGTKELMNYTLQRHKIFRDKEIDFTDNNEEKKAGVVTYRPHLALTERRSEIFVKDGVFEISDDKIRKMVFMTDWGNEHGVMHLRDVFGKKKIEKRLKDKGFKPGDKLMVDGVDISRVYLEE